MSKSYQKFIFRFFICLVLIFTLHQFLQLYTFSNENNIKEKRSVNSPIKISANFEKINRAIALNYIEKPFYTGFIQKDKEKHYSKNIEGHGTRNEEDLAVFLKKYNQQISNTDAYFFAIEYIKHSKAEGINHDIAFVQMCLETGFLKFGGIVLPEQNNFCGLGAINENTKGAYFETREMGIIAHIQHLKAYASSEELNLKLVDPRFEYVKRGSVKTFYELTGKWAIDPQYGQKLENLLSRLYSV